MTGPEHYKIAEKLIAGGIQRVTPWGDTDWVAPTPEVVARAQVHATLALAAATASGAWAEMSNDESRSWDQAIGVER
ncbi:hypothetical protein AMES_6077 [Amycolatopsis mediterranei S699]|uniref:Uncharacterized protein n=3 Tax=Amycolatopsis mediterranei TaxID=33910 RepID=A0A0H3DCG0_AMYMU|nr:hypothetical protein [Amycolatopsis mediterranei]ABX56692.1 TraF [Amycolatopsis mediterranei]ADJ42190.1 hypothetical protein AMED_0368 [Amycolatopsis mediterranei U32]ADJ47902.1 hypothetical protein AMED_6166 [Amycolatopsis mediterranei U32]AEK44797.1 hypothetical protein RAM_31610 [Amycolatopsis mediterranei S699]AFO73904.1 hypothetical protein AMES_0368 [Amycolatopsis mediterranei S699]